MNNKCPKCGKKLSLFYLKENCPECGTNILYYDMENRLEEDARRADEEFEKLNQLIEKVTPKFIKNRRDKKKAEKEAKEEAEKIGISAE